MRGAFAPGRLRGRAPLHAALPAGMLTLDRVSTVRGHFSKLTEKSGPYTGTGTCLTDSVGSTGPIEEDS